MATGEPNKPSEIVTNVGRASGTIGSLTPGQLWSAIGALVTLAVGAFLFGTWIRGLQAELAAKGVEYDHKLKQDELSGQVEKLKAELDGVKVENKALRVKSEFLENCDRYYRNEKDKGEAIARRLFVDYYRELARTPRDMKANGYVIHHGQNDPEKECKIEFADSPGRLYSVPTDVKRSAILTADDLAGSK